MKSIALFHTEGEQYCTPNANDSLLEASKIFVWEKIE